MFTYFEFYKKIKSERKVIVELKNGVEKFSSEYEILSIIINL